MRISQSFVEGFESLFVIGHLFAAGSLVFGSFVIALVGIGVVPPGALASRYAAVVLVLGCPTALGLLMAKPIFKVTRVDLVNRKTSIVATFKLIEDLHAAIVRAYETYYTPLLRILYAVSSLALFRVGAKAVRASYGDEGAAYALAIGLATFVGIAGTCAVYFLARRDLIAKPKNKLNR